MSFLDSESDEDYDISPLRLEIIEMFESPGFIEEEPTKTSEIKVLKHEKNEIYEESLFIVTDIYHPKICTEIILHLFHSIFDSNYTVRLRGIWVNSRVKVGDPLFVIAKFNEKHEAIIDNNDGYIVLWPLNMITATRLSHATLCSRKFVLLPTVPFGMPSSSMIAGSVAHELVQMVLSKKVNVEDLQEETEKLVDQNLQGQALPDVSRSQLLENLNNIIDRAGEISFENESMPPYGCTVIRDEEYMVSSKFGIIGISDVTLQNPKTKKYLPLEMKSGQSLKSSGKPSHETQLSLYIMMMKDKYKNLAEDYGMLFYMENSASFKIQPHFRELQSLILLRNLVVEDYLHGNVPEKRAGKYICDICDAFDVCGMKQDIEDIQVFECSHYNHINYSQNEGKAIELSSDEDNIITSISDDTNLTYDEYLQKKKKYNNEIMELYHRLDKELLSVIRNHSFDQNIRWTIDVNEREKMGMAINDLTLVRCGKKFRLFSKKEIDKSKIDEYYNYSGICITKNGKLPIICFGTTGKISKTNASDGDFIYQQFAYSIRIHLDFDSNFQDNETDLCIDFTKFPFGAMEGRRNLSRLFIYTSNKRFNNICNILSTKSHMKKKRNIKIDNFYGMNNDQRAAIKKSIETKNYSVISGYKSTGKTVVLTTLLNYFDGMNTRVLVVGPSDDSLDYLCMQIIDQIKFVRIITEVPSNPIIAKNSLAVITHDCKSSDEIINKLMNYHIYISSIFDVNDPCLGSSLYYVLIVEDCENIPIHLLLGPITRCNRYIFCGNLSNLTITHSIFSFIDMNSVFFLRTQYSKSYPIYCLENALIYNYSAKLENNSLNEKGFIPCLAMLNQFHEIHQKWITPLLSSSTFVLFSPESNENNNSFKMNALIIAMLTILLIIIGYQPDVIGILTYDKKEKKMIQKCIKHFLVSSSKWFENELSDYTSIKRLIQIHHFSIFRNKVDYQNKNPKILIVSFSTAQIIPANDAMISLVEAREKLYIIGNEKSLRSNPFFNKMINLIGNSIMFPTNIHDVDCTPFEGAAQIFRNLA